MIVCSQKRAMRDDLSWSNDADCPDFTYLRAGFLWMKIVERRGPLLEYNWMMPEAPKA